MIDRAHNLHITTIVNTTSRPGVWHDFKIKLSADDHEQKDHDRPKERIDEIERLPKNGGAEKQNKGEGYPVSAALRKTDPSSR